MYFVGMNAKRNNAYIKALPVRKRFIWIGAFLFTLFAILQAFATTIQGGAGILNKLVFVFWPLNYAFWALMIPYVFHSYFVPKGKNWKSIMSHIGIALFWCTIHYAMVSLVNGLCLNIFFQSVESINLLNYVIYYFPTSILSHLIDYVFIAGILLILDFYRKNHKSQLAIVQLEKQLKSTQLDALRMQLNPHFFFNTLNTIASFMGKNEKGQELIGTLGRFLRAVLKDEKNQLVSLQKELEYIRDYLSIEELRFEDQLSIQYQIDEDTLQARVPVLILQPIIENAIKHGLVSQEENGQLIISSIIQNGQLILKVIDNGLGSTLSFEEMLEKPGLGLNNVKQRLDYLYPDNHTISIRSAEGEGFELSLGIPYEAIKQDQISVYYDHTDNHY